MSLYLVSVGHSLQCLSKTTTILHQSISSVKVKVILGEKIVDPKMICLDVFVSNVFIHCRGKKICLDVFVSNVFIHCRGKKA